MRLINTGINVHLYDTVLYSRLDLLLGRTRSTVEDEEATGKLVESEPRRDIILQRL